MLRKIRIALAAVFYVLITLLFLDFTGVLHQWFGWLAKIQFLPALLALNVAAIIGLIVLTLIFGRVYCSVICPLGVFQDVVAWIGHRGKRLPYTFSKPKNWLRWSVFAVFVVISLLGFVSFLDPYGVYGRFVHSVLQPAYMSVNNVLATWAERTDSYAFYNVDVWLKSLPTLIVAVLCIVIVTVLAFRGGRTYCNSICPVGTFLGFLARFSWLKPVIDTSVCVNCGICARKCKASCIDAKEHKIDYSRCVGCMDCLYNCHSDAIAFCHPYKQPLPSLKKETAAPEAKAASASETNNNRRSFLIGVALASTAVLNAQVKRKSAKLKMDGGLAEITPKQAPQRQTPITPAGSISAKNMESHCVACQLCVSACPNDVLRPSTKLNTFMHPEMSYERGFCRPECTKCADVCPAGAIHRLTVEEKASTQIGHAVFVRERCVAITDGQPCGNCARRCPNGAILMVPSDPNDKKSIKIPAVDETRCIGCGACENLCPSRPLSAIYVEGLEVHHKI
ncbi:MAG: 4Fe-4S binding protein [Bacteroidales bacterium]|nr:4Fe-4S binding protein [Bacteroidales bacterium]